MSERILTLRGYYGQVVHETTLERLATAIGTRLANRPRNVAVHVRDVEPHQLRATLAKVIGEPA